MDEQRKEITELKHEAAPGYRNVFYIVFAIGIIYLGLVFL